MVVEAIDRGLDLDLEFFGYCCAGAYRWCEVCVCPALWAAGPLAVCVFFF